PTPVPRIRGARVARRASARASRSAAGADMIRGCRWLAASLHAGTVARPRAACLATRVSGACAERTVSVTASDVDGWEALSGFQQLEHVAARIADLERRVAGHATAAACARGRPRVLRIVLAG